MTNFEYYKDKILEIIEKYHDTPALMNGRLIPCEDVDARCEKCSFHGGGVPCQCNTMLWLYSEHIEQPKLTKKERLFCELAETGWIARDDNGALYWYAAKPEKDKELGGWYSESNSHRLVHNCIFSFDFSFIKFEDTEPWAVKDLLKLEVEE